MRRGWQAYLVALLAVCIAIGLRFALDPWLGLRVPYITLFGAVIVAAWFGGFGPAIFAAALSWVLAQLLFVEPLGKIVLTTLAEVIELAAYIVSTTLVAALGGEMQRARRESTQNEQRFRSFMQNTPNGVFLKDEEGRYLFMNRVGEQIAGRSDWPGKTDHELLPEAAAGEIRAHDKAVLDQDAPSEFDLSMSTPKGPRTLHSVKFPLRDAEGRRYVGSITADVTDQRAAEQALREADRRKDQFIATLAHELRNPLAPIRTAVNILGRPGTAESDRAWSREVIERQVAHMTRLVDDLLDVARVTSGKLVLRRERVTLQSVVAAALETSAPVLDAAGHRLVKHMPAAQAMVDGDATRLAQVVSNLLNNAAKYTRRGGAIELRVEQAGGEAVISVLDNGMGFPPELAPQLFEPFTQWAPVQYSAAGLGIGLSLVRGIAELHGGRASGTSAGPGKGSRFEVRLPLAPVSVQDRPSAARSDAVAPPGVRVLVADDNRDAADTLCRILAMYGYEVRSAYDGGSALAVCESFRPQVAVLDIGMPVRNGYEVARELRAKHGAKLRLIALSGWGGEADVQRAREAGFDHHVTKPADPATLNEVISRL